MSANRGYVSKENMGDSQKMFSNNNAGMMKILTSAEGQKQFKHPGSTDRSVIDRDHSGVKSNNKMWHNHPHGK